MLNQNQAHREACAVTHSAGQYGIHSYPDDFYLGPPHPNYMFNVADDEDDEHDEEDEEEMEWADVSLRTPAQLLFVCLSALPPNELCAMPSTVQ